MGTNEKPFIPLSFTLAAVVGTQRPRMQFETSNGACVYFAEGPGISPGGVSFQFDENEEFRLAVGAFIRVRKFDKLRVINNLGVPVNGKIFVSADPDFLFMMFPMGI